MRLLRRIFLLTVAAALGAVIVVVSAMLSFFWTMNRPVDLDDSLSDLFDWDEDDDVG